MVAVLGACIVAHVEDPEAIFLIALRMLATMALMLEQSWTSA
jgi:hypothetical protein